MSSFRGCAGCVSRCARVRSLGQKRVHCRNFERSKHSGGRSPFRGHGGAPMRHAQHSMGVGSRE